MNQRSCLDDDVRLNAHQSESSTNAPTPANLTRRHITRRQIRLHEMESNHSLAPKRLKDDADHNWGDPSNVQSFSLLRTPTRHFNGQRESPRLQRYYMYSSTCTWAFRAAVHDNKSHLQHGTAQIRYPRKKKRKYLGQTFHHHHRHRRFQRRAAQDAKRKQRSDNTHITALGGKKKKRKDTQGRERGEEGVAFFCVARIRLRPMPRDKRQGEEGGSRSRSRSRTRGEGVLCVCGQPGFSWTRSL
ncbi:hypothetical protein V8C26DRAFT_204168 [Trichoderma gracile]